MLSEHAAIFKDEMRSRNEEKQREHLEELLRSLKSVVDDSAASKARTGSYITQGGVIALEAFPEYDHYTPQSGRASESRLVSELEVEANLLIRNRQANYSLNRIGQSQFKNNPTPDSIAKIEAVQRITSMITQLDGLDAAQQNRRSRLVKDIHEYVERLLRDMK